MAALVRLSQQCLKGGLRLSTIKRIPYRNVNTPPKKDDELLQTFVKKDAWVSYGFDTDNKQYDRHAMHLSFFVIVSICIIGGGALLMFQPNRLHMDWVQREAYLQIRYREEHGLPLVDPNLVDPATIELPSDEELKDTEIII